MTEARLYYDARATGWDPASFESPSFGLSSGVELRPGWRASARRWLRRNPAPARAFESLPELQLGLAFPQPTEPRRKR